MASLNLKGAVSGQVSLTVPSEAGATTATLPAITGGVLVSPVDMTLPSDLGTNGQALTTDGAGNLSWATVGTGGARTVKTVTTDYTLELADANAVILYDSLDPGLITVPYSGDVNFPVGTEIEICQVSTGSLSVFGALEGAQVGCSNGYFFSGNGFIFNSPNQSARLVKTGTDTWNLGFLGYGAVVNVPTAAQVTIPDSSPNYSEFTVDGSLGENQRIIVNGDFNVFFANFGVDGYTSRVTLEVINTGSFAVNWPPNSYWPAGSDPSLTPAGGTDGRDIFSFMTMDGGATIYCTVVGKGYFLMFD